MQNVAVPQRACLECGRSKPPGEYYYNRKAGTYFKHCKDCVRTANLKRYHDRNPGSNTAHTRRETSRRRQLTTAPDVTSTNTTTRGLGWQHQLQRARLIAQHIDGSPCYWCGRGTFLSADQNWDGNGLEADHSIPRSAGGTIADRLMHRTCNRARGDGDRDHLRPALSMPAHA